MRSIVDRLFSPVEVQGHLPATPDEVFSVLSDPTTYPAWLVGAQRIRGVDPAFPAPSSRFEHSVGPSEAVTIDDESESVVVQAPHRLVLDVHIGPLRGTVDFGLNGEAGGTHVVFREWPTGAATALAPLLRPLLYARNATSLRRLRDHFGRQTARCGGPTGVPSPPARSTSPTRSTS